MDIENEIIGYISPIPLYNNSVPRGSIFKKVNTVMYQFNGYSMPIEIVKRWTPIYRQEENKETNLKKIKSYRLLKDLPNCPINSIGELDKTDNKIYFGIHGYTKDEILTLIGDWFEFVFEKTQEELWNEVDETIGKRFQGYLGKLIKKYKIIENE